MIAADMVPAWRVVSRKREDRDVSVRPRNRADRLAADVEAILSAHGRKAVEGSCTHYRWPFDKR